MPQMGVNMLKKTAFCRDRKMHAFGTKFPLKIPGRCYLHIVIGSIKIGMPCMLKPRHFSPFEFHINTNCNDN